MWSAWREWIVPVAMIYLIVIGLVVVTIANIRAREKVQTAAALDSLDTAPSGKDSPTKTEDR